MKTTVIDTQFTVQRGGTSQAQRALPALATDYVLPEERDHADFLILLQKFSKHLHFYNPQNQKDGDWSGMLEKDLSYILAEISKENTAATQRFFNRDFIGNITTKAGFKNIFDFLFSLLFRLEKHFLALPVGHPLAVQMTNLVQSALSRDLAQLVGFYKFGLEKNLIDDTSIDYVFDFPIEIWAAQDVLTAGFSKPWFKNSENSWTDLYANISADDALFGKPLPPSNIGKIEAARENLAALFDKIFKTWGRVVAESAYHFEDSIENYDGHQPHVSLLLAFLKMMDFAHDHLNSFTQQHLDFYYKDVLALPPKAAEPDAVHLTFELQKNVADFLLEKGTPLKAGKDDLGKEVIYEIAADTALNKAKVEMLHSVFIEKEDSHAPDEETRQVKRIYSAPVANSADGLEPLEENTRWPLFGTAQNQLPEIGFAVASAMLFLEGGTREIILAFDADADFDASHFDFNDFKAEITGEKDWLKISLQDPAALDLPDDGRLYFYGILPPDAEATFPYDSEIHGGAFQTSLPLLRVVLKNEKEADFPYQDLKNIRLEKLDLEVRVSRAPNVQAENSLGAVDASKPFFPFGPQPEKGDFLEIAHREAASKNLTSLEVELEWKTLPEYGLAHNELRYLKRYVDYAVYSFASADFFDENMPKVETEYPISTAEPIEEKELFHRYDFVGNQTITDFVAAIVAAFSIPRFWVLVTQLFQFLLGAKGRAGFALFEKEFANLDKIKPINNSLAEDDFDQNRLLKIKLQKPDFGHSDYPNLLTDAAINTLDTAPEQPFTPEVASVSLNYTAVQTLDFTAFPTEEKLQIDAFENRTAQFFHSDVFGARELHPYLNQTSENLPLFPQFDGEGEFYIGLKDLKPPQNLSLLFQLAEGSENPLKDNPKVHWSFLDNNQWVDFQNVEISDTTDNLVKSGIITFSFPKNATAENSRFTNGLHWLRAHVEKDTDGVSQAIAVLAQAAQAVFVDNENDPNFLATPLEAGTVKGLAVKDAAIKKVTQPYNSFGGRAAEADEAFYTRVSERLRHKERAVTIWDYEHLILEYFPAIYKVKCLPHTEIAADIYNEKRSGHLAIVPIPNLKSDVAADPLKPYTSKALRNEIENFLKIRTSKWVRLTVDNPQFEEVEIECVVELYEGRDETIFQRQLQQDLTEFLSPWAFDETSKIDFGGRLHESEILDFIEEREYVNFLRNLRLFHTVNGARKNVKEAVASTGRSILVSVPQEQHSITIEKVCVT